MKLRIRQLLFALFIIKISAPGYAYLLGTLLLSLRPIRLDLLDHATYFSALIVTYINFAAALVAGLPYVSPQESFGLWLITCFKVAVLMVIFIPLLILYYTFTMLGYLIYYLYLGASMLESQPIALKYIILALIILIGSFSG